MRINIYGVGRSGTKAVQLWAAYLLAQEFGAVWVGYEPFRYQDRTLKPSSRGRTLHRNTPLFLDDEREASEDFRRFCEDLGRHDVGVTKFVRANGRINAIEKIMQPDLSLLIVRDLYQVLASIAVRTWNLVEDNFEWNRLCRSARRLYPFLEERGRLRPTTDKLTRDAIYWFTMNQYALDNLDNTLAISYDNLGSVEVVLARHGLWSHLAPISDPMFRGDNIHHNYPLEGLPHSEADSSRGEGRRKNINGMIGFVERHALRLTRGRRPFGRLGIWTSDEHAGTMCRISKETDHASEPPFYPRSRVVVCPNDFFDELSERVGRSLETALKRASVESDDGPVGGR